MVVRTLSPKVEMATKNQELIAKNEEDLPRVFNQVAISSDGSTRVATQVIIQIPHSKCKRESKGPQI